MFEVIGVGTVIVFLAYLLRGAFFAVKASRNKTKSGANIKKPGQDNKKHKQTKAIPSPFEQALSTCGRNGLLFIQLIAYTVGINDH